MMIEANRILAVFPDGGDPMSDPDSNDNPILGINYHYGHNMDLNERLAFLRMPQAQGSERSSSGRLSMIF
jgi:hypothetical protein